MLENDWQRGCIYPTLWSPMYALFVPRMYLAFLGFTVSSIWYVASLVFSNVVALPILPIGMLGGWIYGFFAVRREPFYFDIIYTKIMVVGQTKFNKLTNGNYYTG